MKKSILVFLFVLFLGSYPMTSFAIVGTYAFGGNILTTVPCTCTKTYGPLAGQVKWITVGPPRAGSFLYIPEVPFLPGAGTDLRAFFSLLPGAYILGLSTLVDIGCWQESGTSCVRINPPLPTPTFMMILAGTSYPI